MKKLSLLAIFLLVSCAEENEQKSSVSTVQSNSQLYLKCDVSNPHGTGYVNILFLNKSDVYKRKLLSFEYSIPWEDGFIENDTKTHHYAEDVDLYYWNPKKYEYAHINRKTLEFKWFIDDIFNENGPTLKQGFPRSGQCKKENTNNVI